MNTLMQITNTAIELATYNRQLPAIEKDLQLINDSLQLLLVQIKIDNKRPELFSELHAKLERALQNPQSDVTGSPVAESKIEEDMSVNLDSSIPTATEWDVESQREVVRHLRSIFPVYRIDILSSHNLDNEGPATPLRLNIACAPGDNYYIDVITNEWSKTLKSETKLHNAVEIDLQALNPHMQLIQLLVAQINATGARRQKFSPFAKKLDTAIGNNTAPIKEFKRLSVEHRPSPVTTPREDSVDRSREWEEFTETLDSNEDRIEALGILASSISEHYNNHIDFYPTVKTEVHKIKVKGSVVGYRVKSVSVPVRNKRKGLLDLTIYNKGLKDTTSIPKPNFEYDFDIKPKGQFRGLIALLRSQLAMQVKSFK